VTTPASCTMCIHAYMDRERGGDRWRAEGECFCAHLQHIWPVLKPEALQIQLSLVEDDSPGGTTLSSAGPSDALSQSLCLHTYETLHLPLQVSPIHGAMTVRCTAKPARTPSMSLPASSVFARSPFATQPASSARFASSPVPTRIP
jgi:hypothetical protein